MQRVVVAPILASLVWAFAGAAVAGPDEIHLDRGAADDLYLTRRPAVPAPDLPADLRQELARREVARDAKRREAITMLRDFLASDPGPEADADGLFKLAELLWEDAREDFLTRMDAFERGLEACRHAACDHPPAEPRIDLRESELLYRRLLADHPDFDRADLVTYLVGFAAREDGREADALAMFRRVVETYPSSRVAGDAWMMIGEHHFAAEEWDRARAAYGEVLERPDAPTYDLAVFKTAWTEWKLGEVDTAAARFKQALDLCHAASSRHTGMCDDSLAALVTIFTEDKAFTAKEVHGFLASIGGERYATDVVIKVAESYTGMSEYERAADAYGFLIERDPLAVQAAAWQRAVVDDWNAALDHPRAAAAIDTLLERYGPRSTWATRSLPRSADREAVARSLADTEQLVRVTARNLHAEAQAREQADHCKVQAPGLGLAKGVRRCGPAVAPLFAAAADAYRRYLAAFGTGAGASPPAAEVRYLRAQILYLKLGALERAGDELMTLARTAPVGRYHKLALETAMDAYERARPAAAGGSLLPVDKKFGEALELYARLFPGKDVAGLVYRNGKMFYDHGLYPEAIKRWSVLVTEYPDDPNVPAAADGILDGSNRLGDFAGLERFARAFRALPAYASTDQRARLDRLIAEAIGKIGDRYAGGGRYAQAARAYLRLRDEFPRHPLVPEKLMNAGVMYERAKRPELAAEVYLRLARDYPKSAQAARAAFAAGEVYETVAAFDRAAAAYETVIDRFPGSPRRADAIYQAGRLRQALGQYDRAIAHYRDYARNFGQRPNAADVAFNIGVVHEAAGKDGDAERAFTAYARTYASTDRRVIEAQVRAARAAFRLGQYQRADGELAAALAAYGTARGSARADGAVWAAEARYYQGELVFRKYERISLAVEPRALTRALAKKKQLLDDAKRIYDSIADFNEPRWVTAALYRTGGIYDAFAEALTAAPIPPGLSAADRTRYQAALDQTIIEVQGLALQQFEAGLAAAAKLQLYDEYTVKIRRALERLDPVGHPPEREARSGVRVGDRPLPPRFVEEVRR